MRARTVSSGGISIGLVPTRPAKDLVGENAPVAAIAAAVSPVCLRKSRRVLFIRGSRVWLTATELRNEDYVPGLSAERFRAAGGLIRIANIGSGRRRCKSGTNNPGTQGSPLGPHVWWCPATHRQVQGSKDTIRESGGSSSWEERPSHCNGSHHASSVRSHHQLSRIHTAIRIKLRTDHCADHRPRAREVVIISRPRLEIFRSEYARAGNQCADGGQPHALVAIGQYPVGATHLADGRGRRSARRAVRDSLVVRSTAVRLLDARVKKIRSPHRRRLL